MTTSVSAVYEAATSIGAPKRSSAGVEPHNVEASRGGARLPRAGEERVIAPAPPERCRVSVALQPRTGGTTSFRRRLCVDAYAVPRFADIFTRSALKSFGFRLKISGVKRE